MPMLSSSRICSRSSLSILNSWPEYLPKRTLSPAFHAHRLKLPVLAGLAGANSDDFTHRGLFCGGIRDHDAAGGLTLFLEALEDNAIVQWKQFHGYAHV